MTLSTRSKSNFFEFIIKADNVTIQEDVSVSSKKGYVVPDDFIQQLITSAFDATRHNNVSDVDTVKMIIEDFLTDGEKSELIGLLTEVES